MQPSTWASCLENHSSPKAGSTLKIGRNKHLTFIVACSAAVRSMRPRPLVDAAVKIILLLLQRRPFLHHTPRPPDQATRCERRLFLVIHHSHKLFELHRLAQLLLLRQNPPNWRLTRKRFNKVKPQPLAGL